MIQLSMCACASVGLYDAWIEGNTVTINWCSITRRKTFPNSISCSSSNSRKAEKNNVTAYPILYCLPAFIGWNDTINKNDKVVRLLATAAAATVHNNCLFIAIEWNKRESMLNISPFIRGKEKVVCESVLFSLSSHFAIVQCLSAIERKTFLFINDTHKRK